MSGKAPWITFVWVLAVVVLLGIFVALMIPSVTICTSSGLDVACENNLGELYNSVQTYKSSNEDSPPPATGGSEASNWAMFLKDNGQGAGTLNNQLYFCTVLDRTSTFSKDDFASDDGDYMFRMTRQGTSVFSEEVSPGTPIAADCISRDGTESNHGNPAEREINVILKNSSIQSVKKNSDLFERAVEGGMIGGRNTENPYCPEPSSREVGADSNGAKQTDDAEPIDTDNES